MDSELAIEMLNKHQWAGTAHGMYGTARRCPECKGIHPDDAINEGGGRYTHGKGHNDGCGIAKAIGAAQCPFQR